jgi:hypothetical protein
LGAARPENDRCDAAMAITSDAMMVSTDTTAAWPHGLEVADCSLHEFSRGAFYTIQGTGGVMAATLDMTTMDGLEDDTRLELAILSQNCEECIKVSDFLTPEDMPHTLEFETAAGQTYVVAVSGERFADVGAFQITMEVRSFGSLLYLVRPGRLKSHPIRMFVFRLRNYPASPLPKS